jgi:hypothetical protein
MLHFFQGSSTVMETPNDETATLDYDGDSDGPVSVSEEPVDQAQMDRNQMLSHAESVWAYIEAANGWSEEGSNNGKGEIY